MFFLYAWTEKKGSVDKIFSKSAAAVALTWLLFSLTQNISLTFISLMPHIFLFTSMCSLQYPFCENLNEYHYVIGKNIHRYFQQRFIVMIGLSSKFSKKNLKFQIKIANISEKIAKLKLKEHWINWIVTLQIKNPALFLHFLQKYWRWWKPIKI